MDKLSSMELSTTTFGRLRQVGRALQVPDLHPAGSLEFPTQRDAAGELVAYLAFLSGHKPWRELSKGAGSRWCVTVRNLLNKVSQSSAWIGADWIGPVRGWIDKLASG